MKINLFRTMNRPLFWKGLGIGCLACLIFASCGKENSELPPDVPVPTGLQHQVADISATLSWDACTDVDSYEIDLSGTAYATTTTSKVIDELTPGTDYSWKVRAVKDGRYSEWSQTESFRTATTSLIDRFAGNWSSNDAVIYFLTKDYMVRLDSLLFRDHTSGTPVTVAIAKNGSQPLMTVTGMDAYITGGTSAPSFNIDGQLVNLPLTVKDNEGTVSTSKDVSSNNLYTASPNVLISDIPNYQELLGSNASMVQDNRIKTITFRIHRISIIGELESDSNAIYSFEYEITITEITHDLSALQKILIRAAGIDPDKLAELIPHPQLLLSDVACTK
jgi:hypothetical protein